MVSIDVVKDVSLDVSSPETRPFSTSAPASLLLHWEFEEGSGTAAGGTVGPDGTLSGESWDAGIVGTGAVELNGTEIVTDEEVVFGSDVVSVAFWVYPRATSGDLLVPSNLLNPRFAILYSSDMLQPTITDGGSRREQVALEFSDQWVHLAFIMDNRAPAGRIDIYRNGILQDTALSINTKNATGEFASDSLQIGSQFVSPFNGLMDDFRLYSGILTRSQINDLITLSPQVMTYANGDPRHHTDGSLRFWA